MCDDRGQASQRSNPQRRGLLILYTHGDGSMEIVEFDDQGEQLCRTYCEPPAASSVHENPADNGGVSSEDELTDPEGDFLDALAVGRVHGDV